VDTTSFAGSKKIFICYSENLLLIFAHKYKMPPLKLDENAIEAAKIPLERK
jgi:hypothetical protein